MESESSNSAYHAGERKKSNLAFAFFCLEPDRAKDMEAFYAFCRLMDDIADDEGPSPEDKRRALQDWKCEISAAYADDRPLSPLGEEMRSLVRRRKIPEQYVQDIVDGVMRDTCDRPFETFEDIKKYCYGVASAVGLASIYIFGFKNERTKDFAEALGYALQFTNILRDVVDDIRSHGRVYIPSDEMAEFGVSRGDLLKDPHSQKCRRLYSLMHFRAKHYFNKARRLLPPEDRRALAPALIMGAIYEKILDSLKALDFKIPEKPLKISKAKKIALALAAVRDSKRAGAENKFGKVAVLGAGVAGISAALRLAEDGFDVSLYEAKSHLGGRCAAFEWKNAKLDNGTHAAMGCYKNFFALLEKLGALTPEFISPAKRIDFFFPDGKTAFLDNSRGAMSLKGAMSFARKLGFANVVKNARLMLKIKIGAARAKDGETAAQYLGGRGISREAIAAFWEPFCVSALNTRLEFADANLMLETARRSLLGKGDAGTLMLPRKTIAEALDRAGAFINGAGGKIFMGETVRAIHISNGKIVGISTSKCDLAACDYVVSALSVSSLKNLLPESSALRARISGIAQTAVTNVYFTTPCKIFDGECACLIGSPLHWIFDHTDKISGGSPLRLYGITVSDDDGQTLKPSAESVVRAELKRYFGDVEVLEILPATFMGATISADSKSEAARPDSEDCAREFSNMRICGDWVKTGLPCTIESAAKSAQDFNI